MALRILLSSFARRSGCVLPGLAAAGLSFGLLLNPRQVVAQSADDFFHAGAQSYITNNIAGAREQVDRGLTSFPDDVKLKKLDELLKQQQQDQQKQNQQKQDQQQQSQQDQQKQQQPDSRKDAKTQNDPKPQEQKEQPAQQAQAGNLDKQQAKALLDNLKEDERNWNFFPEVQMKDLKDSGEPAKDW
jgi:hypothetical protein